jgi:hypothetical protein
VLDFDGHVAQLRAAEGGGFDVGTDQARIVLNRWIKRLATISRWVKEERELGPTVSGQDTYAVDPDIVEIELLVVGGAEAERKSRSALFRLKNGSATLRGGPPWIVYAHSYLADGSKEFSIFPGPDADGTVLSGASITGLCAVTPGTLSGGDIPPFPDDQEETLLNGAKSELYRTLDEDPDSGDRYEQLFLAAAEDLRRRGNAQVGSGFFQIVPGRRQ